MESKNRRTNHYGRIMRMSIRLKKHFTLIEMLVVIAIISILASILLPALQKAKDQVRSLACKNNLKQIAILSYNYASDFDDIMPASGSNWTDELNPWANKLKWHAGMSITNTKKANLTGPCIFFCKTAEQYQCSPGWQRSNYGLNGNAYGAKMTKIKPQALIFADGNWRAADGYYNDHIDAYSSQPELIHRQKYNAILIDGHVEDFSFASPENFDNILR